MSLMTVLPLSDRLIWSFNLRLYKNRLCKPALALRWTLHLQSAVRHRPQKNEACISLVVLKNKQTSARNGLGIATPALGCKDGLLQAIATQISDFYEIMLHNS